LIESSDLYMFTGLSPVGSIDPPLTIIESLILGTPVVSYDTGGIGEVLNGNNLVPYHDSTSLAKTASEILHDHSSKEPRPDLLTTYGSETAAKRFEQIYQGLL
jgi:glycosyltransferase involved in cell wall biosynthesis